MNRILVGILLWLSILSHSTLASLLAIDYGSDWIKASLMSPGVPFDVLLNKDSKRKIQSTVAWKKEDRLFASDAYNIAGRFPTDAFPSLKYLQSAPYDSPTVSYYMSISTTEILETSRGTVALRRSDGSEWSVEELIAMQFAYVRDLAETSLGGEKVTDVILTIPPYFTQHERDAVIDAVEIAGMRTLALIHDGSAVGVNYAMTRTFDKENPEYHIIYDAGASAIRATLLSFSSVPVEPKSKQLATQITVHGAGFDRQVGGTEMDRRLREMLIRDFDRKYNKDIRADRRGMAKLWKEAGRVKAILSANADATASVESLAFDIDFRTKVTRNDFESACRDLKPRFVGPIYDALDFAGLTMDNITSVILTGGATRTPMIQSAIKAAVGDAKIAKNVNTDEAAVLGAALYGAGLSRQFKTKDIRISDIGIYDIQVSYEAEAKSASAKLRTINTVVFPAGSKVGSRKTLTFKRKDNFALRLNYKDQPLLGHPSDILEAEISGIPEALANLTERGAVDPVVKATVVLSDSGFVSVHDAVAYGEIKDDSIAGKLKGLFGTGSSSEEPAAEQETVARSEDSSSSVSDASASPSATPVPEKKASSKDNTIALEVKVNLSSVPPMSVAQKRASRDRLAAIDKEEAGKRRREEARNSLEGYLYRVRDLLEDEPTTPFMKCSQEQERTAMREKMQETFEWLHEDGDDASTADYIAHRAALESFEKPVVHRYQEIEEFPKALNASQMWNWSTRLFLTEAHENLTASLEPNGPPSKHTVEELDALEKTLREHEVWLNEWVEKQKAVKMNQDPILESSELKEKAKKLEMHLQRLVKKKAPKVKKAMTSSKSASATSTTATTTMTSSHSQETEGSGHDEL
ncbi:hypothetical protein EUX98_g6205 [Antrodiella citrinella]|uniref:Actin-like ATPase domain-containing protein n=1 Tax=Antrodiella citrinella TaxID=2447956 RepID=A0A4S4MQG9_9APHY|nr:hypothetical protein EUX98_g6205 [Antrodiella citrinella]